jgi:hypothetical protein
MNTTQLTIRKVDPVLKRKLVAIADKRGTSINDVVLGMVREKVGLQETVGDDIKIDWSKHAGVMGPDGFNQTVLDDFENIDQKMWQ